MRTIYLFLITLMIANFATAQSQTNTIESTPYIEVDGEGKMEIIPDEIYLQFTIQEYYDGKTKIELDDMEKELKKQLLKNNFNIENLTLADANADYITIKRKKKDVLASKDYEMKVTTTKELSDLIDILDEVRAQNAYIAKTDHSQIEELKKEVKIMAVKNAKEKATYLLEAVDEKIGQALIIQEQTSYINQINSRKMLTTSAIMMDAEMEESLPEISFQKITLNYTVSARFAIE